jgi:hypothetical protein
MVARLHEVRLAHVGSDPVRPSVARSSPHQGLRTVP